MTRLFLFLLSVLPVALVAQSAGELGYEDRPELPAWPVGKVVGHGGGFPGLNANLDIFLDKGYIVVVMSNHDRGALPVARRIYDLIGRVNL